MGDALLPIRVKARASRIALGGERAGRLLVEVTAAPVDGRANDAVCRLLAKELGIAGGRVRIVSGKQSRDKVVRVDGMSLTDVNKALGLTGWPRPTR